MKEFCKYNRVYTVEQEKLIASEFRRFDNHHFLDHAGATLYSEKQIKDVSLDFAENLYCNPHGSNNISRNIEDVIDIIRYKILKHFNTNPEEYSVIFTSSATAALKLVAENFNFNNGSNSPGNFVYLQDNHTSVLGMRSYAKNITPITPDHAFEIFSQKQSSNPSQNNNSLFVYPAQSNFSGTKYPLEWIEKVHRGILNNTTNGSKNWFVVLDAASFASTSFLDLSAYCPDFVPVSFYKIFGYPTGLGALLVRNSSAYVLEKKYYGGGTVAMILALDDVVVKRNGLSERFEDGSPPFLSIAALKHGFETIERFRLTVELISEHTFRLARYLFRSLMTLHHANGRPAVQMYHDTVFSDKNHQGGVVNFNVTREDGEYVGYAEVLNMASVFNIHLRTGCQCNPGACQYHLKLTTDQIKQHFKAGHVCGDQRDSVDGVPTGSVRVSFGYMSRKEDADAILRMIEHCYVTKPIVRKIPDDWTKLVGNYRNKFVDRGGAFVSDPRRTKENTETKETPPYHFHNDIGVLEKILIYPIKSCGPFIPKTSWKLDKDGLIYDRKWMIINRNGTAVTQKHNVNLCLIKPHLDLKRRTLTLTFQDSNEIAIPFDNPDRKPYQCESKVCRDRVIGTDCGDLVAQWLSKYLNTTGLRLIEKTSDDVTSRVNRKGEEVNLSFANQCQYLLINLASVKWLKERVEDEEFDESIDSMVLRFRPNLVVNLKEPFVENGVEALTIDGTTFKMSGKCTRCQMVCINQLNGEKTKEPLITLSREFQGSVQFGIYLSSLTRENSISNGSDVRMA